MLKFMEKLAELKRAKLLALSLLLIAAALFITTLLLPPTPWVSALKAISEAAMVGALADWFAVVALASSYSAALCRPPYRDYPAQQRSHRRQPRPLCGREVPRYPVAGGADPPLSTSSDVVQLVQPAGERPAGLASTCCR